MQLRNKSLIVLAVVVPACVGHGTWAVERAKDNLVTLDVRDMVVVFADFHVDKL